MVTLFIIVKNSKNLNTGYLNYIRIFKCIKIKDKKIRILFKFIYKIY